MFRRFATGVAILFSLELTTSIAAAQTLPQECVTFTDDPVAAGITTVKAIHITELRTCVSALRAQRNLAAMSWTDAAITSQVTTIKAAHVTELRIALNGVYSYMGLSVPAYAESIVVGETPVRASHFNEIRQFIRDLPVEPHGPVQAPALDPDHESIEYYHTDLTGSVRMVTDSAGAVVIRHDYLPFGQEWPLQGDSSSFTFAGKERDSDTDLHYFGARYYANQTGRFTSVDPAKEIERNVADPQNWNRYAYARNNPFRYSDPDGRAWWEIANLLKVGGGTLSATWGLLFTTFEAVLVDGPDAEPTPTPFLSPETAAAVAPSLLFSAGVVQGTAAAVRAASATTAVRGAVRYGPMNPGPLPAAVANTFRSGSYTATQLAESTTLYRAYGGTAGALGSYWTRIKPSGPLQATIDLALDPQWGNTASKVMRIQVPAGTKIYEGAAAAQGGLVGGGNQIFLPAVNPGWALP